MQKKTLVEQLNKKPMVSARQTVTITSEESPDDSLPKLNITFIIVSIDGNPNIESGSVSIVDRSAIEKPLKEYPLPGTGIYIYYSSEGAGEDEIVTISMKEEQLPESSAQEGHTELLAFLEAAKDAEAIQAYRSLALYWTAIQSGLSIVNGDIELELEADEDSEEDEEDDLYGNHPRDFGDE